MPDTIAAPTIEGQGIPVELRDVEPELTKLWGPAAEQVGGPEPENPHVTRVVLANLVVECLSGNAQTLATVLETVMARFPCRAILLCGSDNPARKITAEVSALCHLPAPGLPQVCSERIVLRAGPTAIDLLPGAVRSLLEANLPHLLWWTGDPRKHEPLFRNLAATCSRLVLDLPDPGTDAGAIRLGLDPGLGTSSRDSVWFGLARWRELAAQFFDAATNREKLNRVNSVTVEAQSSDPARTPRVAIWMVSWLAGQLGWKPQGRPEHRSADDSSFALTARLLSTRGEVSVRIVTRAVPPGCSDVPQIAAVTIKAQPKTGDPSSGETYRLVRPWPGSPAILVETETESSPGLPRGIDAPELDAPRRVATALEASHIDIPFRNALPVALWLLDRSP